MHNDCSLLNSDVWKEEIMADIRRKIYDRMLEWKRRDRGASALLIDGARRVGKSYIAEKFARSEYRSYILIDFAKAPQTIKDLFDEDADDLDLLFGKLSAYYGTPLHERDSALIFDEVQMCPSARQLVKYLVQDGRYDYIETGSLLTLKQNVRDIVIPSEEEHLEMFPLDFEEFLWALGDETTIPFLKERFDTLTPVGQALHRKIMNDFRQYMLVGGMPQAVAAYAGNKDFAQADRIKKRILNLYREDVSKFARGYESRVYAIFDEIPGQLSKKDKKYRLTSLNKKARFREYEDAFVWLSEAMIVNTCVNATDPTVGLSLSRDHTTQKCYMADTGLLVTQTFVDDSFADNRLYRDILFDKINVNEGMVMENAVAQTFRSAGHKLFFYSRADTDHRENHMEIDFLIRRDRKICPVEVKSAAYRKHSSLDKFMNKFRGRLGQGYVLYPKDVMVKDGVVHAPLYMSIFL